MSDKPRYPNVVRLVSEAAWAIRAEKLVAIRELLALRVAGERFSAEEIKARLGAGAGPAQRQASKTGTVAVLPLYGTMIPRANLFSEMSGGTSVEQFSAAFRALVDDPNVGAILLDVDSPGGMTDLVPELAAEIRAARGAKPIVAIANTDMASAAYWVASQADEVVASPSSMVGSIGVFAMHTDLSEQQAQDGVKTTLVSAGKFKTEANPFEPLSDEALATIQDRVDQFHTMFVEDVAKGRGVAAASVRDGYGQGRVMTAQDALGAGMVDRVDTFEATVERLIVHAAASSPSLAAHTSTVRTSAAGWPPGEPPTLIDFTQAATSGAWPDIPPGSPVTFETTRAADSGLSFAAAALAVRDAADRLTTDAEALRAPGGNGGYLTVAKRDALAAVAESLRGSADTLACLVAAHLAQPLSQEQRAYVEYIRSSQR